MENIQWPSSPDEVQLEATITRSIREMGSGIHVEVNNGRVTVSGSTIDFETKREILSRIRSMPGVREVRNRLLVAPGGD